MNYPPAIERDRVPRLIARLDEADWVVAERAADAVLAAFPARCPFGPDRAAATLEVLRRGGRSAALKRLGWSGTLVSAWLAWWDTHSDHAAAVAA